MAGCIGETLAFEGEGTVKENLLSVEKGKGVLKPVMARGSPGKEEFGG